MAQGTYLSTSEGYPLLGVLIYLLLGILLYLYMLIVWSIIKLRFTQHVQGGYKVQCPHVPVTHKING
jgi:hypothetical protein